MPTPSRERPAKRQGQQDAVIVDRRVPKLAARPANHLRTGIGIVALLAVGAVATGAQRSDRLVSAFGKAHLLTTSLLARTGVYGADSRRGPDVRPLRTALYPPAANGQGVPSYPKPNSYGLFVASNGELKRLETMRMRVPDTRIALGGLITKPSPVTLPDGKLSFIAFQRDLITNAPDNASVRVIARVQRALKFSAAGKPVTTPVEDTWAVRSVSVDLTVAPMPESQEMVLLRPSEPEFTLSPGRYMLVYKNQAYDFSVAGAITDTAQCLERTDFAGWRGVFGVPRTALTAGACNDERLGLDRALSTPEQQSRAAANQAKQDDREFAVFETAADKGIGQHAKTDPEQLLPLIGVIQLGNVPALRTTNSWLHWKMAECAAVPPAPRGAPSAAQRTGSR